MFCSRQKKKKLLFSSIVRRDSRAAAHVQSFFASMIHALDRWLNKYVLETYHEQNIYKYVRKYYYYSCVSSHDVDEEKASALLCPVCARLHCTGAKINSWNRKVRLSVSFISKSITSGYMWVYMQWHWHSVYKMICSINWLIIVWSVQIIAKRLWLKTVSK